MSKQENQTSVRLMPNGKTDSKMLLLAEKKKAEPNAMCRWCEKPVEYWDQYAEEDGDGMSVRDCCPHCGNSYYSRGAENLQGCAVTILMVILLTVVGMQCNKQKESKIQKKDPGTMEWNPKTLRGGLEPAVADKRLAAVLRR